MVANSSSSDLLKQCQYLWEEYKYRHDLIWQRTFKFTTAIVLISLFPYLRDTLAMQLKEKILIAPLLAFLLAIYNLAVIRNELARFNKIKYVYRLQQEKLFKDLVTNECKKSDTDENKKSDINECKESDINECKESDTDDKIFNFSRLVQAYFIILALLAFLNGLIVWEVYICHC